MRLRREMSSSRRLNWIESKWSLIINSLVLVSYRKVSELIVDWRVIIEIVIVMDSDSNREWSSIIIWIFRMIWKCYHN